MTNHYPVDSTTRTCCGGIGRHTRDCERCTVYTSGLSNIAVTVDDGVWLSVSTDDGHGGVLLHDELCLSPAEALRLSEVLREAANASITVDTSTAPIFSHAS